MIRFRHVHRKGERTLRPKNMEEAQRWARRLMGRHPKMDPDGYVVNRQTGDCLFLLEGASFEELFPAEDPK